ncbi:MAG: hypothetical protein ACPKM0_03580 [Pleomorphochaeta sp.]
MAYSCSEKIEIIKKEIASETKLLNQLYKNLGENVAFYVKDQAFSFCVTELANYEISKNKYSKILLKKNSLKSKVEVINENRSEIFSLRDELLVKKEEESKELSRFGAAIYEAYVNKQLDQELVEKLDTIFNQIHRKMSNIAKKRDSTTIILLTALYEKQLDSMQKSLLNLFIESANFILKENLEDKLVLKNKDKYLNNLKVVTIQRKAIEENIKTYEKQIEEIQTEDIESPNRKLEEMKSEINTLFEAQTNSAILLGKELYKVLPDEITSKEIGKKAISLIDDITIKFALIDSLEEDIEKLNNEIFISELSAQIAHERKKIKQLNQEINNCNSQICKIEDIIKKKRDKIIELKEAGTFEKSTIDLILKGEDNERN